jgi:hypothetical protein
LNSLAWDISIGSFNPGNFIGMSELRDVPLDVILVRFPMKRGDYNVIHVGSEGLVDKCCYGYNNKLKDFIDIINYKFDIRKVGYLEGTEFNIIATNITSEEFESFIENNKSEIESYIQSTEKLSWDIGIALDGPYTKDQLKEMNISYGTIICAICRQDSDIISYGCVKQYKDNKDIFGIYSCVVPFKGRKPESNEVPPPGRLDVSTVSGFYIVGQANSQAEFDDFIKLNNDMIRKRLLKYIKSEKDLLLSWDIPDLELKVGSKVRIKNKTVYIRFDTWVEYDSEIPKAYKENPYRIFYIVNKGPSYIKDSWVVSLDPSDTQGDFFATEDLELVRDTLSWDIWPEEPEDGESIQDEAYLDNIANLIEQGYTSGEGWSINYEIFDQSIEMSQVDYDHVASLIREGYNNGELFLIDENGKEGRGWWHATIELRNGSLSWDIPEIDEFELGEEVLIIGGSVGSGEGFWKVYSQTLVEGKPFRGTIIRIVHDGEYYLSIKNKSGESLYVTSDSYPRHTGIVSGKDLVSLSKPKWKERYQWDIPRLSNDFEIGDRIRIKEGTSRLARSYSIIGELPIGTTGTVISINKIKSMSHIPHIGVIWDSYPLPYFEEIGYGFVMDNAELI